MYDQDLDSGGGFRWDPPEPAIPPGFFLDPQTGQLKPYPTPEELEAQRVAINGQTSQLQPGVPEELPTIWPTPAPGPTGGGAAPGPAAGGGSLIQPFTQPYVPAGTAAPGGGQALGSPSDYLSTIPGAPQFPNIPRFQAPTIAEAMAEPGYDFVLKRGNENLQNWAAARGTLNDSSTAKSFIDYGQSAATTQYGNVWDRAAQTYDRNVTTQYLDPFAAQFQNWMSGTVNPTMTNFGTQTANIAHGNDVHWQDNWNSWLQNWNQFRDQRDSTFNKQFSVATA